MKKTIAFILTLCVLLTVASCGSNDAHETDISSRPDSYYNHNDLTSYRDSSMTDDSKDDSSQSNLSSSVESSRPVVFDESVKSLIAKSVSFTGGDFSDLNGYLSGIRGVYPHAELYGIKEAYAKYLKLPKYTSTHENYFADGIFTGDELYNIAKANNKRIGYKGNKVISDDDLKHICNVAAPVLLEYGKSISASDAALLSEKVSEFNVFAFSGFAAGSYDAATSSLGIDVALKNTEKYDRNITHEITHMVQGSSQKENAATGIKWRFGYCYVFDEEIDQPLNFRWLFEGSAEILNHNRLNSRSYDVYENYIKLINYIKAATVLSDHIDDKSFEELSLSSDIGELFDYFDCKTDSDRYEILDMLCSINYYFDSHNVAQGFKNRYKEKYGAVLNTSAFHKDMLISLGTTLSRVFYKNLAEALVGKSLSIEEIFAYITLFEHRLSDISLPIGTNGMLPLMETYCKIQERFFEALANKASVTTDEIRLAFDAYYPKGAITADVLKLLSHPEAQFLQYTTESSINKRFRSLYQTVLRTKSF